MKKILTKIFPPEVNEWEMQFFGTNDSIRVLVSPDNQNTFISTRELNTGEVTYSIDGVTYQPVVLPFTPDLGVMYFKRPLTVDTGIYVFSTN